MTPSDILQNVTSQATGLSMLSLLDRDGTVIASTGSLTHGDPEEIGALAQRHRTVVEQSTAPGLGWLRLAFDELVLFSVEVGEGAICIVFVEKTEAAAGIRKAVDEALPALAEALSG